MQWRKLAHPAPTKVQDQQPAIPHHTWGNPTHLILSHPFCKTCVQACWDYPSACSLTSLTWWRSAQSVRNVVNKISIPPCVSPTISAHIINSAFKGLAKRHAVNPQTACSSFKWVRTAAVHGLNLTLAFHSSIFKVMAVDDTRYVPVTAQQWRLSSRAEQICQKYWPRAATIESSIAR